MSRPLTSSNMILVVQGAQYGSEAKGAIAAALCEMRNVDFAVRTGTVNAGHTVYHEGQPFKMQQLPTAWAAQNPRHTNLVIGAGAYIHPYILLREIQMVSAATNTDVRTRLAIDHGCGLHLPSHTERSERSGRHHAMGATGKGCSEAVIDKIRGRGDQPMLFRSWLESPAFASWEDPAKHLLQELNFCDTSVLLNNAWDEGGKILIEGTQGTFLDLHLGPYPFTTHKQTQVGNWMAEAGLSPALPTEIVLVARTFPIRVAGNSGPLPREINWIDLARAINDRLWEANQGPLVADSALEEFARACEVVGMKWWKEGKIYHNHEDGREALWRIENWKQEERAEVPAYMSELHREAYWMKLMV